MIPEELKNIENLDVLTLKKIRDKCVILTEIIDVKLEQKKREEPFYV